MTCTAHNTRQGRLCLASTNATRRLFGLGPLQEQGCSTCGGRCIAPQACAEPPRRAYEPDLGLEGPYRRQRRRREFLQPLLYGLAVAAAASSVVIFIYVHFF
jgi:hypothetical protein